MRADYSDARVLLSNIYSSQGQKEKAIEVMQTGASANDPKQLFNLGLALLNSGKNQEAAEAFLKVEAADPTNAEAQYYLATGALSSGRTEECVTRLEKYLALGPKSDQNKGMVRAKAKVRSAFHSEKMTEDESRALVEKNQPKLQLTEKQTKRWSGKRYIVLIEVQDVKEVPPFAIDKSDYGNMDDWLPVGEIASVQR